MGTLSQMGSAADWAAVSNGYALKFDGSLWVLQSSPGFEMTTLTGVNGGFVQVSGSNRYKALSANGVSDGASSGYAVALREDGTLWALGTQQSWGMYSQWAVFANNSYYGGRVSHSTPIQLGTRSDWTGVSAGIVPLAVDKTGKVFWVMEASEMEVEQPRVPCSAVCGISDYMSSSPQGIALGLDGTLWAWGNNSSGQFGNYQSSMYYMPGGDWGSAQVGVDSRWGLEGVVRGIPVALVFDNLQSDQLGAYTVTVNGVPAGGTLLGQWSTQPTPARLAVGGSLVLSAGFSAGASVGTTYQWFRNGTLIAGATSGTYRLPNAQVTNRGVYTLAVSGSGATVRSEPVAVVVEDAALTPFHTTLASVATNPTLGRPKYVTASTQLGAIPATSGAYQSACVLKALTDLYLVTSDSAAQAALIKLGITGSSDPLNFTLKFSVVPAAMLTADLRAWLTVTLYPKLLDADTLLGKVTDTTLLGAISDADLGLSTRGFTPFDFGDVQAMRAGVNFAMAWLKWIETLNTDADLAALRLDQKNGLLSLESLLSKYPSLAAASSNGTTAQGDFVTRLKSAITYYIAFSDFANPLSNPTPPAPKRLAPSVALARLDSLSDQLSENVFRLNCLKFRDSIVAASATAGLKDFYPGIDRNTQERFTASPYVFVNHLPGWRSELPSFSSNAYKAGSFKPETVLAAYPGLSMRQLGEFEKTLAALEPRLNNQWKTGRETVPPTVALSTVSSGTATLTLSSTVATGSLASSGWITVSGTVSDNSGINRVTVQRTTGTDAASASALLVERARVAGVRLRTYDWSAQLPASLAGRTLLSARAEDARGNYSTLTSGTASITLTTLPLRPLPAILPVSRQLLNSDSGQSSVALASTVLASGAAQFQWKRNGLPLSDPLVAVAVDDWAAVGAGANHTLAIKRDGSLWAWGSNDFGQLGDGTNTSQNAPVQIGSERNWALVSGGENLSVAVRRDGTLWVWGSGYWGSYLQPTKIDSGTSWSSVSAGRDHVLALTRAGSLYAFGSGNSGQLGNGSSDSSSSPILVGSPSEWAGMAAGAGCSYGVKVDGTLWAWGDNSNSTLGLGWSWWGWNYSVSTPARVGQDSDWSTVSPLKSSNYYGNNYTAAVKKDGSLWAWGRTPGLFASGQVALPTRLLDYSTLAARNGFGTDWASVTAGDSQLLARRRDGSVFSVAEDSASPVAALGSTVAISSGRGFNVVLSKDGRLWAWGGNYSGQLGNFKPRDMQNPWMNYADTYASDPIQVGVNSDWGLSSPVSGIPLPLTVDSVDSGSSGVYTLTVTQGASQTTSSATLYAWNTQPAETQRLAVGARLSLTGSLSAGASAVTYQWTKNGTPLITGGSSTLTGGSSATVNSGSISAVDSGIYQLRATSGGAVVLGQSIAVAVDSAYVALARVALARKDYPEASNQIALALASNPADGTALLLRSVLDLYFLWNDPATTSTLSALGFSGSADPWNFSLAFSPAGFPKGALSITARNWLLTNFYPKLLAAEGNLAKIVSPGFVTILRGSDVSPDASAEDAVVDYGDVVLFRSIINGFLSALKWLETQNTDVDFSALQTDRVNGRLSVEFLLANYPKLLTASATGTAAQAEFLTRSKLAMTCYQSFSDFVNPAPGSSTSKRVDPSVGTARLEDDSSRNDERNFRDVVNKTLSSIGATDAVLGQRTIVMHGGSDNIIISPTVFFNHAPGWRSDLPVFVKNRYIPNTLNRALIKSAYPGLTLSDIAEAEEALSQAEDGLNQTLGTRADSSAPIVDLTPPIAGTSLTTYDGWVYLEGTAKDPSGVSKVTLTTLDGTVRESYDATLEPLDADAFGNHRVRWSVSIALPAGVTGTLKFEVSARDYKGAVTDVPVTQSLTVLRKVPLFVGWQGPGSLTYNITPAADDDGFVTLGSKVVLTAIPNPGGILRRIETIIDGESLPVDPTRPPATTLTITGDTVLNAVFEANPYLLVGGRNKAAGGLLTPEFASSTFTGITPYGFYPLSALQVAVTSSGALSGKLMVGRNTYAFGGRFDADSVYNVTIAGNLPRLDWAYYDSQTPPKVRLVPLNLHIWVDTSNGTDAPVLRALINEANDVFLSGVLTPLADADYSGPPLFTGSFVSAGVSAGLNAGSYSYGTPPNAGIEGGYFSISARKSGAVIALGALSNGERFTASSRLTNRNGQHSDLEFLTPTGTNGVFAFLSTLPQPGEDASISGSFARREAWYSGARGPVFVTGPSGPTPVFASHWVPNGAAFVPAPTGQTLIPFATHVGPRAISLNILSAGASSAIKAFDVQSVFRNAVSAVPGSAQAGFRAPALSLSLGSGLLSGSVVITSGNTSKRVTLQGVLLQGGFSGWLGRGVSSDGRQFVLGELVVPVISVDMVPIPAGSYQRGNLSGDSDINDAPVQTVNLSAYYMAVNDTTKDQWDTVRTWALAHGYTDLAVGAGKASNHPVQTVSWYDVVKWANAASEKDGLTPCYSVSRTIYRTGQRDDVACNWSANGYRLPTEAEWEVASRGGLTGMRFPLGDTISQSQANYYVVGYSYDLSGDVNGCHPTYATGKYPYTSPVGSFAANGYGLYDMAGNVLQWCWDWYGTTVAGSNPRGASADSFRVLRGSRWDSGENHARCAQRHVGYPSYANDNGFGFRLARGRP